MEGGKGKRDPDPDRKGTKGKIGREESEERKRVRRGGGGVRENKKKEERRDKRSRTHVFHVPHLYHTPVLPHLGLHCIGGQQDRGLWGAEDLFLYNELEEKERERRREGEREREREKDEDIGGEGKLGGSQAPP